MWFDRSHLSTREDIEMRMVRLPLAGLVLAVLGAASAVLVPAAPPQAAAATWFAVLQLNLCNGGDADCYQELNKGRSVPEAVGMIKRLKPDAITVNEICRDDISRIEEDTGYRGEFAAARSESSGGPYPCENGDEFGIGILTRFQAERVGEPHVYSAQDRRDEQRVYACVRYLDAAVCATHLSTEANVASQQCEELMGYADALAQEQPTVVAGDLNLKHGSRPWRPDVQDCVPDGWFRKGDGDVQHVMATARHFNFERAEIHNMSRTDHEALLVELTLR